MTAKEIFQAQREHDNLRSELWHKLDPSNATPGQHAYVHEQIRRSEQELAKKQAEVGGKVYRIPAENLPDLYARIEKLNKRAAKLSMEPLTVDEVEREEETRKNEDGTTGLRTWVYTVVKGQAPTVGGYTFVASLDHTNQNGDNERVLISRTPYQRGAVADLDISAYFNAGPDCDHCGYQRNRNSTYLLYSDEDKEIVQVGSTCVKDFIVGANDPNRAAHMAEYLIGLDRDLDTLGGGGGGGFRITHSIRDYCANVAACLRERGWVGRRDQFGDRNYDSTADQAWENLKPPRNKAEERERIAVTEEDYEKGEAAIQWAREHAQKEDPNEFEHNMIAVTAGEYMPEKGDGIVAYVVEGHRRSLDREKTREAEARITENAEPITEGKQTITGTVLKTDIKYYDLGEAREVMTVLDDRGFKVWGTVPRAISGVEAGTRIQFAATVKPKEGDPTFGFFKRPSKASVIEGQQMEIA